MSQRLSDIIEMAQQRQPSLNRDGSEKPKDPVWEGLKNEVDRLSADYWKIIESKASKVRKLESGKYTRLSVYVDKINGCDIELVVYEPKNMEGKESLSPKAWYALFHPKEFKMYRRMLIE